MRRLGSAVTVIDHNPRVLHREDEEVSLLLKALLERDGVKFFMDVTLESVSGTSGRANST